jgi:hypothetical protein
MSYLARPKAAIDYICQVCMHLIILISSMLLLNETDHKLVITLEDDKESKRE